MKKSIQYLLDCAAIVIIIAGLKAAADLVNQVLQITKAGKKDESNYCWWRGRCASCAARLRSLDEKAEILMVEKDRMYSYANYLFNS